MQALPKDLADKLPISAEAKKKKYSPAKIACFRKCMKKVGKKAQKECLAKCSKKKDTKKTEKVDTKKDPRKKDSTKAPPERRKGGGGGGGGGGRGRREPPLRQPPPQQQVAQPQMMPRGGANPIIALNRPIRTTPSGSIVFPDGSYVTKEGKRVSAKEATNKKGRTQTMGGSVVTPRGTVIDDEGNVRDEQGDVGMGNAPPPPAPPVPRAPPTVETEYQKSARERRELDRVTVEMENVDPQFAEISSMDTSAIGASAPAPAPAPAKPTKKTQFAPRPRITGTSPAYNPIFPGLLSPPALDLDAPAPSPEPLPEWYTNMGKEDSVPAPAPTLGQLADAVGITGGDAMARKQKRNEKRQALGRLDEEQRRTAQRQATRSTDTTASEMTARRPPPLNIQSAQQQPGFAETYGTPYDRLDSSAKDSLIAYGNQPSTIPPVQRHSEMTQIPGMRQSTSAIQGHGVDEPEALKEALRRSRMGSRVAQAVQNIEGPVGRRTPVLVDPADEEEEKEETDLQESKTADDDLETYEEMREGVERSKMGVEDVRLPMPAVRQEPGQRASIRIAGARGTFNRNFSSYNRVPLGGAQPIRPLRAQVLAHQKEPRTDIDWSKHRLEKRARATIALLENTQPRQRARAVDTNITPQQVSSVQSRMQQYRQVTRGLNEAEVFRGTNRVERYNTQPAITVSAEPVVPAEPVATVELDEGGDEL